MNFIEQQTTERAANLLNSLNESPQPLPTGAEACLGMTRRDIAGYSILRAIAWKIAEIGKRVHPSAWSGAHHDGGVEAEAHRALALKLGEPTHQGTIYVPSDVLYAQRDLTVASGPGGGYLVGTTLGSFISMLTSKSVLSAMGAQRVPNQRDNLSFPKQTVGPTFAWQSTESSPAQESTPAFVQISASPKTCIAYHEMSRQAVNQFSPAAEQLFRAALADTVAVAGDQAALVGSGTLGQPLGISNTAGIGSVVGTAMDYTKLVELQLDVNDSNAAPNPSTLGYVTTPTVAALLKGRQRFVGTDSPLWRGQIAQGEIEGCRAMSSKQMLAATMLFGDFSTVYLVEWGVLAIEVNPFADFKAGIVGIRALWSMDVIIPHPGAFSLASSIT